MTLAIERVFPFLPDLRRTTAVTLRRDVRAGLTVAVFAIPQTMAYAVLAGVSPAYGLYAAIVMSVVAALWGSSAFVNTGPTNSAALLTAAAMIPYASHPDVLRILFAFTLLVGLIRVGLGLIRAGKTIDYVPESAFLGFTIGVGTLIALGQFHHLLQIDRPDIPWFPHRFVETLRNAGGVNVAALLIGMGSAAIMFILGRFTRRVPIALLAIAAAAAAAALLDPEGQSLRLVRDLAPVPNRLPGVVLPAFDLRLYGDLLPAATAVAVIGLIEAVSIGRQLALKHGHPLDYDQEFIGQGLSHVVGSFFQGIPGSGSFSRSLLIEQDGGQTRFANVVFGGMVAVCMLLFGQWLNRIPICALAGLLLYLGITLIDLPRVRRVWATSRADAFVLALTVFVTVFVRIEYGIFTGIVAAAFLVLRRTRHLHIDEITPCGDGTFAENVLSRPVTGPTSDVVAITVGGDLYYAMAGAFRDTLEALIRERKPRFLIVRIRTAYSMDSSLWSIFFDVAEVFHANGGKLYLCGVRPDYDSIIDQARMRDILPTAHIFPKQVEIHRALRGCLAAVKVQLGDHPVLPPAWENYFGAGTSPAPRH